MPLLPGKQPEIVSHNIHEMVKAGHPHDQAVAAALHNAGMRRSKKAKRIVDQHHATEKQMKGTGAPVSPGMGSGAVGGY